MICKVERIKYFSREFKIAKDKPFTSHVYYSGKPADTNSPTSSLEKCPVIFGLIFLSRKEGNILHRTATSVLDCLPYSQTLCNEVNWVTFADETGCGEFLTVCYPKTASDSTVCYYHNHVPKWARLVDTRSVCKLSV